jgi:hypothetical protein
MFTEKAQKILKYVQEKGKEDNLEIRLIYGKMATYNGRVISSGFFEDPETNKDLSSPILVVGIDKDEDQWLEVLLHEFNHYLQWKNKTDAWNKYCELYKDYEDGVTEETSEMLKATVDMESECEKNTIKLARDLNYNINEERYIRKVNAYLLFYQIYDDESKWYKKPPFEEDIILKAMPKEVIENPMSYHIDFELKNEFRKCL